MPRIRGRRIKDEEPRTRNQGREGARMGAYFDDLAAARAARQARLGAAAAKAPQSSSESARAADRDLPDARTRHAELLRDWSTVRRPRSFHRALRLEARCRISRRRHPTRCRTCRAHGADLEVTKWLAADANPTRT